uniref:Secreted protein n=1 Tax=Panagrellus redivivus TaxID=6233 RepID=A0A7E4W1H4_PANRE
MNWCHSRLLVIAAVPVPSAESRIAWASSRLETTGAPSRHLGSVDGFESARKPPRVGPSSNVQAFFLRYHFLSCNTDMQTKPWGHA